jgi:hypothetical protein
VLTRTLGLRRDQSLVTFADTQSLAVAELLARAARELGITATTLFVPLACLAEMGAGERLPLPAEAAIREADAVINCLSDRPEHSDYRRRVLHSSWSRRTKLAHAPGLTLDILAMADTDYAAIGEHSRLLALALLLGRRLEILTGDSRRGEHRLSVRLGGWDHPPVINDGVIP